MDVFRASRVARGALPRLMSLLDAHEQARWQKSQAAGEHRAVWDLVISALDLEIERAEQNITQQLGLLRFRAKRVVK